MQVRGSSRDAPKPRRCVHAPPMVNNSNCHLARPIIAVCTAAKTPPKALLVGDPSFGQGSSFSRLDIEYADVTEEGGSQHPAKEPNRIILYRGNNQ